MSERVLVVVAHPDDEVLGAGATLAKHVKAGDAVSVVVMADGVGSRAGMVAVGGAVGFGGTAAIKERHLQCRRACKILGTDDVWLHQYADNRMDTLPILDVAQHIERHVERFKPTIVYTHHGSDLNVDHRVVSEAVVIACRPQNGMPVKRLMMFEVPSSSEWTVTRDLFRPNHFEAVVDTFDAKLAAMREYTTELREWPHPRSIKGITVLAELRGAAAGLPMAEAFVSARVIA